MRILYVGRFQPFHLGHFTIIKELSHRCDELIVVIGSSQYSHTRENPFTAGERYEMVTRALAAEKIHNVSVIPVEDLHRPALWAAHVQTQVPNFEVVATNDPVTARVFGELGFQVEAIALNQRDSLSGTNIRNLIASEGDLESPEGNLESSERGWEDLLPKEVVDLLMEFDGVARVRALNENETIQVKNEGKKMEPAQMNRPR